MAAFPSPEWFDRYREAINGSEAHQRAAAEWESVVVYVIEADRDAGLDETIYARLAFSHGQCTAAEIVSGDEFPDATFVLRAPYSVWKDVVRGRLRPVGGITTGKIKLRGDIELLKQNRDAVDDLVAIAQSVPTEFRGE